MRGSARFCRAACAMLPLGVLSRYASASERFRSVNGGSSISETVAWREMCFCLLSPMTRFEVVRDCLDRLARAGILDRLSSSPADVRVEEVVELLRSGAASCRFSGQKARRLVAAGRFFYEGTSRDGILGFLGRIQEPKSVRAALVKNVPGLGMKEASHFLRNIGQGQNVAVLDVHLRRFMAQSGLVGPAVAFSGSTSRYASMEVAYTSLAFHSGLDAATLDLAIWEYMRER